MTLVQLLREPTTVWAKFLYCMLWGLVFAALCGFGGYFMVYDAEEPFRTTMFRALAATGFILGFFLMGGVNLQQQHLSRESEAKKREQAEIEAEFERTHMMCAKCNGEGYVLRSPEEV